MKKRTLTLILVLVLALSLSVTALAHNLPNHPTISGGTGAATLTIIVNGVQQSSGSIYGDTLYDGINGLSNASPNWVDAPDWQNSSIIHKALTSLYGYAQATGSYTELPTYDQDEEYATYTASNGITYQVSSSNHVYGGYYLLDTDNSGQQTVYRYLYIGKDWTYSDNNGAIYDYMCDYVLNGQTITLTYNLQTSDWTTVVPLS